MFCHPFGKLLPSQWQDFAKGMARPCHYDGKTLAMYQQEQVDTSQPASYFLASLFFLTSNEYFPD